MNDYEDPEFFTGAFPTLFPYGGGGHMPESNERRIAVSLEAWGKWLMNHHSRRWVVRSYMAVNYTLLNIKQICPPSNIHVFTVRCTTMMKIGTWQFLASET